MVRRMYGPAQRRRPEHLPEIRYRLRMDHDKPPTYSNSHSDLTRIHRTNAEHHLQQRESTESQQVRTGILSSLQTHTPAMPTPPTPSTSQPQWYASSNNATDPEGAALTVAHITSTTRTTAPNTTNMTPGDSYRHCFHRTISRSYYSLGEARIHYDQWLNDTKPKPATPLPGEPTISPADSQSIANHHTKPRPLSGQQPPAIPRAT